MAWFATKRFVYGGHELFPGEFCEPKGLRNDRLIFAGDGRYTQPVAKEHDRFKCDRCGRCFLEESQLRGHQRSLYAQEQLSPTRLQTLKKQAEEKARKALQTETVADLARASGLPVDERARVPTILQS